MGVTTAACCTKENDNNKELLSKKEEEVKVERAKAELSYKFKPEEKKVVNLQKALRSFLTRKRLVDLISKDKKKIYEYLEVNDLFLTLEDFENLMHPVVKDKYYDFKVKGGVFEYIESLGLEFDFMSVDFNQILYQENKKIKESQNKRINLSQMFNPIWLNKEKKVAYMGFWNLGLKPNGYGILIKSDGSRYEGYFNNGQLNGRGRYFTSNGEFFEGNFKNGTASGLGMFIHPDGNIYKGDWHDDKTDGPGIEIFADGSTFQGAFKKGKKNGLGRYQWVDGSNYEGNFKEDLINGYGSYIWADGSSYQGDWKNNLMFGKGRFNFPDGTYYEGDFINNKRSGQGKYIWNPDKYHIGGWKDGKQHGKGRFFKNGNSIEGIWHEGKLMSYNQAKIK
jgi:hypothetical protein